MLSDVPWRDEVVRRSLRHERGYWLPPEAPGLGIEVDEAAAARHPYQPEVQHPATARAEDGAILDW
jgi:galactonate dehydratase